MEMKSFIRVNGKEFSYEELATLLNAKRPEGKSYDTVEFCQQIPAGLLVATACTCGDEYPPNMAIDLHLPKETETIPIQVALTEQKNLQDDGEIYEPGKVVTYLYDREGQYIAYKFTDTMTDAELEEDGKECDEAVVLAGDKRTPTRWYSENNYLCYEGDISKRKH